MGEGRWVQVDPPVSFLPISGLSVFYASCEHLLSTELWGPDRTKEQKQMVSSLWNVSILHHLVLTFCPSSHGVKNAPSVGLSLWCFPGNGSYCQPNAAHCPVFGVGSHGAEACEFLKAGGNFQVSFWDESGTQSRLGNKCLLCRLCQTHLLQGPTLDLPLLW